MTTAELTLTEGAFKAFDVVVDTFSAATSPGAAYAAPMQLGDGGFSSGGVSEGAAPAADGGAAAPAAGGGDGGAAPSPE